MNAVREIGRRNAIRGGLALAASLALPSIARTQTSARVVVIGGGFGGAACARALKQFDAKLQVTLVEPNKVFTACPFSNEVIAGLRDIGAQQFGYEKIAAAGIDVVANAAAKVDPQVHRVTLADGSTLSYDRLVLAPGIEVRFDALSGYDEAASRKMPHAWQAGEQTLLLRRQIESMDDGGVVAIAVPANPLRCPPAPYERASLIAYYLKQHKPRSKVLILDAKDNFSQQRLFEKAWHEIYDGMIERISLSDGGRATAVDPATNTIVTEFGDHVAQVANVIPPQRAGRIAQVAGAADKTGWCPIDPMTFASKLLPDVHVIGDACLGGGIPKSAAAASAQGRACARAIVNGLAGKAPETPRLTGICYDTVAPGYAFSLAGLYQPKDDMFAEIEGGGTSALDAPREVRAREAEAAQSWYRTITEETFG
ncbi:NAD(P)/FAD-dependent oxidoreductase [Bradyrhizobium sp. Tv2a-2]|uniref:NAD(P)/FAD-dependent oxidoreductase n=1 Tax=Bradyrhizobium sp. Tv2a-2 TaxID=113395 RepID=UPI00046548A0|nr:NAD(P)/FAD-dependent oxidoreductase [Bradyrhizobium sp. Tv2a-2]